MRRLAGRLLRDLLVIPLTAFLVYQLAIRLPLVDDNDAKSRGVADLAEKLRARLGADEALGFVRPWQRLFGAAEADGRLPTIGENPAYDRGRLGEALAGSLTVGGLALAFALAIAFVFAGARVLLGGRRGDGVLEMLPTFAYALPSFVVTVLVVRFVEDAANDAVAAAVVSIGPGIFLGAVLYDALSIEMERPYARVALAKGRSRLGVLVKHALQNALPSLLDAIPPVATAILAGSFVVEKQLLNREYFGAIYVDSALRGQAQIEVMVVATTTFAAILVVVSLAAELVRLMVDPRRRTAVEESGS